MDPEIERLVEQTLKDEEYDEYPPVQKENPSSRVVIIDNVPIIPKAKEPLLTKVLGMVTAKCGKVSEIFLPFDADGVKSLGFAFVEYEDVESANNAQSRLNNLKLDDTHTFIANMLDDIRDSESYKSEYVPPEDKDTPFESMEGMYDWLLDDRGRDQFFVRYGDTTEINWSGVGGSAPTHEYSKQKWSDLLIQWSPKGTFLASLHAPGIALWGGKTWRKLQRFHHEGVNLIAFSPNEKYMITYSELAAKNDNPENPEAIFVWDILSGQKLRGFSRIGETWPAFQWCYDDSMFSLVSDGLVFVYEAPSMQLLNQEAIKLHAPVLDHAWSPTDPILACYVPEHDQIPARVILKEMPSKNLLAQQSFVNVVGCSLYWQKTGNFLGVKTDRHKKSKKQVFTEFEFFHVREKGVPVTSVKLEDNVIAFAFEPSNGKRFGIIHAMSPTASRTSVSFYSLADGDLKKLNTIENRAANHLFWSPTGRYCVLAGLRTLNGVFEFYDVKNGTVLADEKKHYMCTDVAWDPSGRYLVTYVSNWATKNENGFTIWSWSGKELFSKRTSPFFQFAWRPRPPSLLEASDRKILANPTKFAKFSEKYQKQDGAIVLELFQEARAKRIRTRNTYRAKIADLKAQNQSDEAWRRSQGISPLSDNDYITVEEVVEDVIDVQEEVVQDEE